MRPEWKYNVGDNVYIFSVHAAVVTARTFDHPLGEWIYTVQYETGGHSQWIAEPNLKPQLTREPAFPASRVERIESAARNVIADYERGFPANNAIIALKRALESK